MNTGFSLFGVLLMIAMMAAIIGAVVAIVARQNSASACCGLPGAATRNNESTMLRPSAPLPSFTSRCACA